MTEFGVSLLHVLALIFQTGLVGGTVFTILVPPACGHKAATTRMLRWSGAAALALAASTAAGALLSAIQLAATLDLQPADLLETEFVRAAARSVTAALIAALACLLPGARPWSAAVAAVLVVGMSALGGHAGSRLDNRLPLMFAAFAHQLAAGVWLGGIPFLLAALHTAADGKRRSAVCRRFSVMAAASVAVLILTAGGLATVYIGSWAGLAGSDFGVMAAVKALLLACLLLLGLGNLRAGPHLDHPEALRRVRAFASAELGLGVAVLAVAVALAAQPPPAAAPDAQVPPSVLAASLLPTQWPRMTAALPAPGGGPQDHAWAEMTHHWAGLVVLAMGILALARRLPGFGWARHWPALFLLIAIGIPLLADPDSWPLGPLGFWGAPGSGEVLQHRLAALLVAGFAASEWAVQTGRLSRRAATMVFPLACVAGGLLLLLHVHPSATGVESLAIHLSHMMVAVLGLIAGAGRWIELAGDGASRRVAAWVWPTAFALVGAVLLLYREG